MVRRWLVSGAMVVLASGGTAFAQDAVISGNIGGFLVRNEEGRDRDDVLRNNRAFLLFEIDEFDSTTFGGDFAVSIGSFVEVGAGLNYYQSTVPSVNDKFVDEDGTEIVMEMKQRNIPLALTAKLFPLTRDGGFQPYIGGGVQFNRWQYTEVGEFLDYDTGEIFRDSFTDDGVETGPVFLAGARFAVGSNMLLGGEWRYSTAKADLDPALGFYGSTLDLGGHTWLFTVGYKFK
jgi:opacity protein-like surface antigen